MVTRMETTSAKVQVGRVPTTATLPRLLLTLSLFSNTTREVELHLGTRVWTPLSYDMK